MNPSACSVRARRGSGSPAATAARSASGRTGSRVSPDGRGRRAGAAGIRFWGWVGALPGPGRLRHRRRTVTAMNERLANFETSEVFHALLDGLGALEDKLYEGPNAPRDEQSVCEGYKWIFSILQVAFDVFVWADTGRPRF